MTKRGEPASVEEVRQFLETIDSSVREIAQRNGADPSQLLSFESIVLHLGRPWTAKRRPSCLRKMRDKMCYRNSWRVMIERPGLRYCEGYAMSAGLMIPVEHAWCVDQDDNVVDPTWREPQHAAYYGVEIPEDVLGCSMSIRKVFGFFGHPRTGHLISQLGRLPTAVELASALREDGR
jgi:hypothetical protein